MYEMPNDLFFEMTGVAQAVWGGATAWYLRRFALSGVRRANNVPDRAPAHVRPQILGTISGEAAPVPDPSDLIHLQFRRFAGCPVCNLHLHTFVRRHDELRAAQIREIVVFHSSADELREYAADLPFAVVPDPARFLYAEFGVDSSPRAVLDPRAWGAILRGVMRTLVAVLRGKERLPPIQPRGGSLGLPGDFLIAPDGRVVAAKYGVHADDQWSVDEVLDLVRVRRCRAQMAPRSASPMS
jgi:peroxiredoxin